MSRTIRIAVISLVMAALAENAASASQGPGVIQGTASGVLQMAMAIIVYGSLALVIAAAVIGSLRHR